jgi:hypothetical protein
MDKNSLSVIRNYEDDMKSSNHIWIAFCFFMEEDRELVMANCK